MERTVKVGVIGAGNIGSVHADSLRKMPNVRITAMCDVASDRLQEKAAKYGVAQTWSDYRRMLKDADMEAVYVCVPNCWHAEMTVAALAAGKHVFCEKPMALNAAQARKMAAAAKKARTVLQLGMVCRQQAESQYVKESIEKGEFGRIYHTRVVLRRRRGVPGLGGWFTTKAMSGGGALIDCGVHFLDLVMWLTNNWKPQRACATTYSEFGARMKNYTYVSMWAGPPKYDGVFDVDDCAAGFVRFPKCTMSFEVAWAMNGTAESYIEIFGSDAGVRLCDGNPLTIFTERNGRLADIKPQCAAVSQFDVQAGKFIKACLGKQKPAATAEEGLAVMEMLDAIYQSAKLGREVRIVSK